MILTNNQSLNNSGVVQAVIACIILFIFIAGSTLFFYDWFKLDLLDWRQEEALVFGTIKG